MLFGRERRSERTELGAQHLERRVQVLRGQAAPGHGQVAPALRDVGVAVAERFVPHGQSSLGEPHGFVRLALLQRQLRKMAERMRQVGMIRALRAFVDLDRPRVERPRPGSISTLLGHVAERIQCAADRGVVRRKERLLDGERFSAVTLGVVELAQDLVQLRKVVQG